MFSLIQIHLNTPARNLRDAPEDMDTASSNNQASRTSQDSGRHTGSNVGVLPVTLTACVGVLTSGYFTAQYMHSSITSVEYRLPWHSSDYLKSAFTEESTVLSHPSQMLISSSLCTRQTSGAVYWEL